MKCILYEWWAYKCCWVTGSNQIGFEWIVLLCLCVHEFNVNELFGVSQCDDEFYIYIQCFLMKLPTNFQSFKFNVRILPSRAILCNFFFSFLVRFQWIASKKLGLRQFYSYFSCRCYCEIFTVAIKRNQPKKFYTKFKFNLKECNKKKVYKIIKEKCKKRIYTKKIRKKTQVQL